LTVSAYGAFGTIRDLFIFVKVGARFPRPFSQFTKGFCKFDGNFRYLETLPTPKDKKAHELHQLHEKKMQNTSIATSIRNHGNPTIP